MHFNKVQKLYKTIPFNRETACCSSPLNWVKLQYNSNISVKYYIIIGRQKPKTLLTVMFIMYSGGHQDVNGDS